MENNKISISLKTFIIIAIVIVILLLGIITFLVYNNINKSNNNSVIPENNNAQQFKDISNQTNNNKQTKTNNDLKDTSNNNETTSNSTSINSATGKISSKQKPLSIGEWGLASKYISGAYTNVPVKISNVIRGSAAAQEFKNFCSDSHTIYKYQDAKSGMEWAIVNYNIDLTKIQKDSSTYLDSKITGTGENKTIKYNDCSYVVSTTNMSNDYSKGKVFSSKFAVQLPIGCTDYLIALGSSSSTQAFFSGK